MSLVVILEFCLFLVLILVSEIKRYLIVLIFLLYIGCEDESSCDVELWGECYSIADTDSLNLSLQQLTGPIPPDIGKLTNLTFLSLATNQLTGSIPQEIGKLTKLIRLNLGTNQLTGPIPQEIGNLSNMTHLQLWLNQLTGEIPTEIWRLKNLEGLGLANNQLAGEIHQEIGNLTNLTGLNLSSNQLTGKIPDNLCDIYPNLSFLFSVSNNKLCPPYPDCLSGNVGQQDTSGCN